MLVTSLATFCCGMASHSSMRICGKSANMVLLVTLARTARPSWPHKCSIGLRSGLTAGHSILSTPKFWRYSVMILALWGSVFDLTSLIKLGPKFGNGTRTDTKWCCHSESWNTSLELPYCTGQTWHLSTSVAAWRNHKPNNFQNPFMWVLGTHLWLLHTCDFHTPASTWSLKREWMPAQQHYRPFWHIFGWHSPHVCLCFSFHNCPMHIMQPLVGKVSNQWLKWYITRCWLVLLKGSYKGPKSSFLTFCEGFILIRKDSKV